MSVILWFYFRPFFLPSMCGLAHIIISCQLISLIDHTEASGTREYGKLGLVSIVVKLGFYCSRQHGWYDINGGTKIPVCIYSSTFFSFCSFPSLFCLYFKQFKGWYFAYANKKNTIINKEWERESELETDDDNARKNGIWLFWWNCATVFRLSNVYPELHMC